MLVITPEFTISEQLFNDTTAFAKACAPTNMAKVAARHQPSLSELINAIRNGKIAEQMVWEQVVPHYPTLTPPDMQIYTVRKKSWAPDLYDPMTQLSIACKAQPPQSGESCGLSWVFQWGNGKKDCDNEIFGTGKTNHNLFVALVSTDARNRRGRIQAIVSVPFLHNNNLFKDMKRKDLRDNKLAVYLEDLEKLNSLWQL